MQNYLTQLVNDLQWAAENLPDEIAYKLLVDYFDKPVIWVSEGSVGIEFCEYEPENCPFPKEFCTCKDFE